MFSLVRLSPPVKTPVNLTWEAGWCRWTAVGLCLRRGGFASPLTHGLLLTFLCSTVLISKGTHCLLRSAQKCPCTLMVVCLHLGFLLISCQFPLDLGSTLFTTQPYQFKACFSSHLSLCVFTQLSPWLYPDTPFAPLLQDLFLPKQKLEWPKNSSLKESK